MQYLSEITSITQKMRHLGGKKLASSWKFNVIWQQLFQKLTLLSQVHITSNWRFYSTTKLLCGVLQQQEMETDGSREHEVKIDSLCHALQLSEHSQNNGINVWSQKMIEKSLIDTASICCEIVLQVDYGASAIGYLCQPATELLQEHCDQHMTSKSKHKHLTEITSFSQKMYNLGGKGQCRAESSM